MNRGKPEPVSRRYDIADVGTRRGILEALENLGPTERRTEDWCDWVLAFEDEGERLVLKQYRKGTLMIQGRAGNLLQVILHVLSPFLDETAETAGVGFGGRNGKGSANGSGGAGTRKLPLPHIGTDESGKGDYFGPLVVGGVLVENGTRDRLVTLGIRDSKKLGDATCRKLAAEIRRICVGKYREVIIPPERYNTLYEEFRREGRNLNHLLAWGHARTIESLLESAPCQLAVTDQFGNESYIRSRLMKKGREIELIQEHRGERYLAVAAASILARDRFLEYLERLSGEAGLILPKGAGAPVIAAGRKYVERHGVDRLHSVAKMHYKTTAQVV
ncbi:MAG: ribonuclease HIII [Gemmatimonadetes bacterium]|nr:ribonuclease HIII [Gemmatimonadota bacterium]